MSRDRRVPGGGVPVVAHALRAADVADSVVHHRRPWHQGLAWAWPGAGAELLARHGDDLHGARRGSRPGGRRARGDLAEPLGARAVRGRARGLGDVDVRRLRTAVAVSDHRALGPGVAATARRSIRQRVRDGRLVGPHRQPLRGRATCRRTRLLEPDSAAVSCATKIVSGLPGFAMPARPR